MNVEEELNTCRKRLDRVERDVDKISLFLLAVSSDMTMMSNAFREALTKK